MKLTDKAAYLKGLMDGLEIDKTSKEGKVFLKMSDLFADITEAIELLQAKTDDLTELCDDIDRDLGEVEEDLYSFDDYDESIRDEFIPDDDYYDVEPVSAVREQQDRGAQDRGAQDRDVQSSGVQDMNAQDHGADQDIQETAGASDVIDDDELYEVECPTCHETIVLDDSALDEGTMECPNCGEVLEFDFNDITIDDVEEQAEE